MRGGDWADGERGGWLEEEGGWERGEGRGEGKGRGVGGG